MTSAATSAAIARSYLFVPGDRPERFSKAQQSGADRIILDLEDAVAEERKDDARRHVADYLASGGSGIVRINATKGRWLDDLLAVRKPGLQGVILPKTSDAEDVVRIARHLPDHVKILPLIETARGMKNVDEIAGAARVERLVFGTVDFRTEMGIEGDDQELLFFRSMLALSSRVAGIAAPVDGVTVAIGDAAELRDACVRGRRLGFGAKLCIHPSQVADVNRAYLPSDDQLAWAERVVEAAKSAPGAFKLDGEMIDAPVIARASELLLQASRFAA